jgi:hypothetical protein
MNMLNDIRPRRPPGLDPLLRDTTTGSGKPPPATAALNKDPFTDMLSLDRLQPFRPPSRSDLPTADKSKTTTMTALADITYRASTTAGTEEMATRGVEEELTTTYKAKLIEYKVLV